jgi:hypothetical protein
VNLLTRAAVSAGEAMVIVAVVTLVRECYPVGVFLIRVIRQTSERIRISQFNGFHGVVFLHDVRPKALKLFVLAVIACGRYRIHRAMGACFAGAAWTGVAGHRVQGNRHNATARAASLPADA